MREHVRVRVRLRVVRVHARVECACMKACVRVDVRIVRVHVTVVCMRREKHYAPSSAFGAAGLNTGAVNEKVGAADAVALVTGPPNENEGAAVVIGGVAVGADVLLPKVNTDDEAEVGAAGVVENEKAEEVVAAGAAAVAGAGVPVSAPKLKPSEAGSCCFGAMGFLMINKAIYIQNSSVVGNRRKPKQVK